MLVIKLGTFCFGGPSLIPRRGPTPLISSHAVVAAHMKKKKEDNWQWILAQGKSSSANKQTKQYVKET